MSFRSKFESYFPFDLRWQVIKTWLRSLIFQDWGTKLVALGITLALWLGVTGLRSVTTERIRDVRLRFETNADMQLVNDEAGKEVEVILSGDKTKIEQLKKQGDLTISLDTSTYKPGNSVIKLTPENVFFDLPSGVKLDEISPNVVSVRLERRIEREISVKPLLEGALPEGFEVYETIASPLKVRVRGPESFVKSLDNLLTEKINIGQQTTDLSVKQVGITPSNTKIIVVDSVVDVMVKIGEKRAEHIFYAVKNRDEKKTKTATVSILATKADFEKIKAADLRIVDETEADGSIKQKLNLPPELIEKIKISSIK